MKNNLICGILCFPLIESSLFPVTLKSRMIEHLQYLNKSFLGEENRSKTLLFDILSLMRKKEFPEGELKEIGCFFRNMMRKSEKGEETAIFDASILFWKMIMMENSKNNNEKEYNFDEITEFIIKYEDILFHSSKLAKEEQEKFMETLTIMIPNHLAFAGAMGYLRRRFIHFQNFAQLKEYHPGEINLIKTEKMNAEQVKQENEIICNNPIEITNETEVTNDNLIEEEKSLQLKHGDEKKTEQEVFNPSNANVENKLCVICEKILDKLNSMNDSINTNLKSMNDNLKSINNKMGNIDFKMGRMDRKLGKIDRKLGRIDSKMGRIDRNINIDTTMYAVDSDVREYINRIVCCSPESKKKYK